MDPETMPPVPNVRPLTQADTALPAGALGGDTIDAGTVAPRAGAYAVSRGGAGTATGPSDAWSEDEDVDGASRHKLVVVGLPLLALALVIALAWWIGSLLSVSGDVGGQGSAPSASAPAPNTSAAQTPAGAALPVAHAAVFDPYGDGEPENDRDVPKAIDGDPATAWSTLVYRGSPAFGNLKPGVGLLLDLGGKKSVAAVTISSTTPGATVEIRTGDAAATDLKAFTPAADGTVKGNTDFAFDKPVTARYVLVWTTGLVHGPDGFSADIAEVTVQAAG
jgi:hypothetical protein